MSNGCAYPDYLITAKKEIKETMKRVKARKYFGHRWLAYLSAWPGVLQITERQVRQSMAAGWRCSPTDGGMIIRFDLPQTIRETEIERQLRKYA